MAVITTVFAAVPLAVAPGVFVLVGELAAVGVPVLVAVSVALLVGDIVNVEAAVLVLVGVGVAGCGIICIAQTFALSVAAGPKSIVILPPDGAMLLNTLSMAVFAPPAAVSMSKFAITCAPFMDMLKLLEPAAVKYVSANLSVT